MGKSVRLTVGLRVRIGGRGRALKVKEKGRAKINEKEKF